MPFNPAYIVLTCPRLPADEFRQKQMVGAGTDDYRCVGDEEFEDADQLTRRCHYILNA